MRNRITDSVWGIPQPPLFLFPNLNSMEEAVLKQGNALQEEQRLLHIAAMALRAQPVRYFLLYMSVHLWAASSWCLFCSCLIPHQVLSAVIPCGLTSPLLMWLWGGRAAAMLGVVLGLGGMLCSNPFCFQIMPLQQPQLPQSDSPMSLSGKHQWSGVVKQSISVKEKQQNSHVREKK